MTPLERAIQIFNSSKSLAEKLNVSPMAVSKWGQTQVPLLRAFQIDIATGGQVTASELRPDVFKAVDVNDSVFLDKAS